MDQEHFVFRDPQGGRWKQISRVLIILGVIILFLIAIFFASLLIQPHLAPVPTSAVPDNLRESSVTPASVNRPKSPAAWVTQTINQNVNNSKLLTGGVRLGFLDDDLDRALVALRAHGSQLTHVAPPWFRISGMPPRLSETPLPDVASIAAQQGIGLMPLLANLVGEVFDPEAVEYYLRANLAEQQTFARELRLKLQAIQAQGVVIVWEQIDPAYQNELADLLGVLHSELNQAGLLLWLAIPVGDDLKVFDLNNLSSKVDRFVAMLYYENGQYDAAGPLASLPWFQEWLDALITHGERHQWIVSIGNFGYDWPEDGVSDIVSFYDSLGRARSAGIKQMVNGPPYDGPSFSYLQRDVDHRLWFLDVTTFWNQQKLILQKDLGGIGIDRLGTEDPAIWEALQCGLTCSPHQFEQIPVTDMIATVGNGDFIEARIEHLSGRRKIVVDSNNNWGESYLEIPHTAMVTRRGDVSPQRVALTFDDGPDPRWTPRILDILKEQNVLAAFFVLGSNASAHPELIRRIFVEGHELGNHTFSHVDLSITSAVRVNLELNATQRAIEDIIRRSTLLFRPPYDADRTPHTLDEIEPLILAQQLGYIPTMASIDPMDWNHPSADEIVARIREARPAGNVILLHDGGGDRSATISALPRVLEYLKDRDDAIVPLHKLLGVSRDELMPSIPITDSMPQRIVAGAGLTLMQIIERGVFGFLLVATGLLFLRTLFIAGLAIWRARQEKNNLNKEEVIFTPPISVILPAFNEAKVIRQTVKALLANSYAGICEIILIDDGSTDQTAQIGLELTQIDPRLTVIRQINQGKAVALQTGFALARYDFIVTLDADTQFAPTALTELIKPLRDPKIGAVSGHLNVGNDANLLGRFQGLEYIAGFNLDRRAYDILNAITVVPGAICAYRAQAIREAGGIQADTLAEDTDLTLSLHQVGYRVSHTSKARAVTEAPRTLRGLIRQRRRWSFGTLQCLWKHRELLFNSQFNWLGWFSIPSIWFFHILLVALVPLIDLWLIIGIIQGNAGPLLFYAILFLIVDLILALVACWLEGEPFKKALLIFPMRLLYRPLLSIAVLSSLYRALQGSWMAWGIQERWGLSKRLRT